MSDFEKVFSEYTDLAMKTHKLEDEILGIPKSAADQIGVSLDMLSVVDTRRGLFADRLLRKLRELEELEKKRGEARKKFIQILKR
jgi:hypothetical protein